MTEKTETMLHKLHNLDVTVQSLLCDMQDVYSNEEVLQQLGTKRYTLCENLKAITLRLGCEILED